MAVCATPTTMIATLAAISSVFRIFRIDRPRDGAASSSTGIGAGIGIDGTGFGIDVGTGGSVGASGGDWTCGSGGSSFAAFLNGHFSHFGALRPCAFGTFTGVSR